MNKRIEIDEKQQSGKSFHSITMRQRIELESDDAGKSKNPENKKIRRESETWMLQMGACDWIIAG